MTVRVSWVCEAGPGIGWGHVQRGLTLSEAAGACVSLVVGRGLKAVREHAARVAPEVRVRGWSSLAAPAQSDLGDADVVVLDHYSIDPEWLGFSGRCIAVMDDWVRRAITADGLINVNLGATRDDYAGSNVRQWGLGASFALIRRTVREASPPSLYEGPARSVLITFGGSDPTGATAAVAERLRDTAWFRSGGLLDVALGRSYRGKEWWISWPEPERSRVRATIDPRDYVDLCASADLVVVGGGTTVYELACLGRPFLPVAHAGNNRRIVKAFAATGMGSGPVVGEGAWLDQVASDVERWAQDGAERNAAARSAQRLVDGQGALRVRDFLSTLLEEGRA